MAVDHGIEDQRFEALVLEHPEIGGLGGFIVGVEHLVLVALLVALEIFRQGRVFVLCGGAEDDLILDLVEELVIAHHAIFDEGMDIVPDLSELVAVLLGEVDNFGGHPTADDFADLAHLGFVLQVAARHVEGQVRSVKATLQGGEKFGDQFRAIIRNKHLVAVQLDMALGDIEFGRDAGKIENPLEVEGEIDIEVNPEQGVIGQGVELAVELDVFLILDFGC